MIGLLQCAMRTCARRMNSSVSGRRSASSPCISATATTTAETGATRRTVQVGVVGAGRGWYGCGGWMDVTGTEGGWLSEAEGGWVSLAQRMDGCHRTRVPK